MAPSVSGVTTSLCKVTRAGVQSGCQPRSAHVAPAVLPSCRKASHQEDGPDKLGQPADRHSSSGGGAGFRVRHEKS